MRNPSRKKEYPQMESIVGFELLRCLPNCRHLEVLDCNWDAMSLKTNVGGQSKIYIRPIQKNIATDNVDRIPKEDTYEECTRCSTLLKIRDLRSHLENCNAGNREVHYLVMENFAPQQDTFSSVILPHEQQPDIPTPLSLSGASNVFEPQVIMTLPNDASLDESFTVDNSRDVMEPSDFSDVSRAVIECKTFCEANNISDPTNILKIFKGLMVTGRPLDLDETSLTTGISGETNFIMIDRNDVIRTSFDEINDIPDLRKCLEVQFYGETAVDYGGPRKEFFCLILQTLQTEYFDPVKEWCNNYEIIGKIMALSTLQNGRLPRLLKAEMVQEVFFSDSERPCVFDLRKGLDSLGLIQLTREMPSLIHLFTPKEPTPVTVKMVTQLMESHFSEEGYNRRTFESAIFSRFINTYGKQQVDVGSQLLLERC
ncbi:uncharacterized protein LOC127868526 [Dreissena polymorpha]|uniref:uncharacterized protein LOC127868526 n=1 Tax=Dreissena polymorpha TaxID=45954 RepID=UPI002263DC7A|nr:uncharacterized protein LOC127868526 [Dreissena polymorpha]